jgi:hypothetical protein
MSVHMKSNKFIINSHKVSRFQYSIFKFIQKLYFESITRKSGFILNKEFQKIRSIFESISLYEREQNVS